MKREMQGSRGVLRARYWLPVGLVAFAGCVLPSYRADPEGSAGTATNAGSGAAAGMLAMPNGGKDNGGSESGGSEPGGEPNVSGAGGSASGAAGMSMGGSAGSTGGGTAGSGPMPLVCGSTQKNCGEVCVERDNVLYGCTATSCNQSDCPTGGSSLGCEGGACVIATCGDGTKKCNGTCVSIDDPSYGCGETGCSDVTCPNPGGGTLICSGNTCTIGNCPPNTKKCGSKCVPLDKANGCADAGRCSACAAKEVCSGSPSSCTCVPDNVTACQGKSCGPSTNNCGEEINCPDTCQAPQTCGGGNASVNGCGCSDPNVCAGKGCGSVVDKCGKTVNCPNLCSAAAPVCSNNQCVECNSVSDCPDDVPCTKRTCVNHTCGYATVGAGTACSAGGTCSTTVAGVCDRPMVDVGAFDIDATPVTRKAYADFVVKKNGNMSGQAALCSGNTTYTPEYNYPPPVKDYDLPVVFVDYCDARAYCADQGKHLCGRIGGVAGGWIVTNPDLDEWMNACVGPSKTIYPYGNTYDAAKCLGDTSPTSPPPERPGTHAGCVGGFPKLYDMVGNVYEWTEQCSAGDTYCTVRGDGVGATGTRCDHTNSYPILYRNTVTGFRCCR